MALMQAMLVAPVLDVGPFCPNSHPGAEEKQAGHDDHAENGLTHFIPPG
jgi:hypothetical protein